MRWCRRAHDRRRDRRVTALPANEKPAPASAGFSCRCFALALVASAIPLVASAQVQRTGDYLQRMDIDADGRVSLAEYQHWMGYAFERMDRDGDGVLVAAELPGGRGRPVRLADHRDALAAAFARQDANGDGVLDAAELARPPR
jgi:hypothetical protein